MMDNRNLDGRRRAALDAADRSAKMVMIGLVLTGLWETALFSAVILVIDWTSDVHLMMFLLAMLVYGAMAFGLVTLAAYVKRNTMRVLAAVELLDK